MPDYSRFEALADVGAGYVQPDHTEDLRAGADKGMPAMHPTKNDIAGDTNHHQTMEIDHA